MYLYVLCVYQPVSVCIESHVHHLQKNWWGCHGVSVRPYRDPFRLLSQRGQGLVAQHSTYWDQAPVHALSRTGCVYSPALPHPRPSAPAPCVGNTARFPEACPVARMPAFPEAGATRRGSRGRAARCTTSTRGPWYGRPTTRRRRVEALKKLVANLFQSLECIRHSVPASIPNKLLDSK